MHALPSTRGAWRATLTALLLGVTMHAAAQVTDESPWAALQNGSIVLFRQPTRPASATLRASGSATAARSAT